MAIEDFLDNTTIGSEFIKHLSMVEYAELYSSADIDVHCPLDNSEYYKAILKSKDTGKILVLAKYARFSYGDDDKILSPIVKMSPAHKEALLSNQRANWGEFSRSGLKKILESVILNDDDDSIHTLVENPRTDRKLLAEAIRGEGKFKNLSEGRKVQMITSLYTENEIEFKWDGRRDYPHNRELYFTNPYSAVFFMIKEEYKKQKKKDFFELIRWINNNYLMFGGNDVVNLDDGDWVPKNEKDEDYEENSNKAKDKFIDWLHDLSKNINLTALEKKKTDEVPEYVIVIFVISVLLKLFRKSYDGLNKNHILKIDSLPNEVFKAAYYGMQFSSIRMDQDGVGSGVKFMHDVNDNLPKLIGVGSVGSIHLLHNIAGNYGGKLEKIIEEGFSGDKAINRIINFSDPQYHINDNLTDVEIHNKYFLNESHKNIFNFRGF